MSKMACKVSYQSEKKVGKIYTPLIWASSVP